MQKLNQDTEQQLIALVKNNKFIEAMTLVQSELKLGLKESKDIVDKYRGIR